MTITREQLLQAEEHLFTLRKAYLEQHGWTYTCKTPGSTWLWTRIYQDDRLLCNMNMALSIQEAINDVETNNKKRV